MSFKKLKSSLSFKFLLYSFTISIVPLLIIYTNLYFYLINPIILFIQELEQNLVFLFEETIPLKKSLISKKSILEELKLANKRTIELTYYIQKSSFIIISAFTLLISCLSLSILLRKRKFFFKILNGINSLKKDQFKKKIILPKSQDEIFYLIKSYNKLNIFLQKRYLLTHILLNRVNQYKNPKKFIHLKNIDIFYNPKSNPKNISYSFFNLKFGKVAFIFIETTFPQSDKILQEILWLYLYTLLKENEYDQNLLANKMNILHKELSEIYKKTKLYFNIFFGTLDISLYILDFINVGFQGAIRFDVKKKVAQMLIHKNVLLPIGKSKKFIQFKLKLNSKDKILLYKNSELILKKNSKNYQLYLISDPQKILLETSSIEDLFTNLEKLILKGVLGENILILHLK